MLNQITRTFSLTEVEEIHIASVPDNKKSDEWGRGTNLMNIIKSSIATQLNEIQNQKCCYCGLQLWETGRGEIEHIAPRASRIKAYPEFTFEKMNLALACEHCNGSSKKGEKNVIFRKHAVYRHCEFKLVHPYFDNPQDHYEWINEITKIVIRHKTWKGLYSIILFKLKDLAIARAKQYIYEQKVNERMTDQETKEKYNRIISFER